MFPSKKAQKSCEASVVPESPLEAACGWRGKPWGFSAGREARAASACIFPHWNHWGKETGTRHCHTNGPQITLMSLLDSHWVVEPGKAECTKYLNFPQVSRQLETERWPCGGLTFTASGRGSADTRLHLRPRPRPEIHTKLDARVASNPSPLPLCSPVGCCRRHFFIWGIWVPLGGLSPSYRKSMDIRGFFGYSMLMAGGPNTNCMDKWDYVVIGESWR